MIASPDNLWKPIKLREDIFLSWFESLCGKYSNLIMNGFRNKFLGVTLSTIETPEEIIAAVPQVKESICHEIVQARNPQGEIRKVTLLLLEVRTEMCRWPLTSRVGPP